MARDARHPTQNSGFRYTGPPSQALAHVATRAQASRIDGLAVDSDSDAKPPDFAAFHLSCDANAVSYISESRRALGDPSPLRRCVTMGSVFLLCYLFVSAARLIASRFRRRGGAV